MNVIWTKYALEDLNNIEDFIAQDDYYVAVEFIDKLISLGDSLQDEETCLRGTPAPWIKDDSIRELYYKEYTICYEVAKSDVIIHEVYNQKRIYLRFAKRRDR